LNRVGQTRPIRDEADLERVRALLAGNPRDLLLFELAGGTGLPVKNLLSLKVGELTAAVQGGQSTWLEDRVSLADRPGVESRIIGALARCLGELGLAEGDFLFKSRKGSGPLTTSSASRMVAGWFRRAGLTGLSGLLTLRRTWERHYRPDGPQANPPAEAQEAEPELEPLRVVTTQERVYQRLERAIISGKLRPGERLFAGKLARQLGVSSMLVRDALSRLEARNFITSQPNRGVVVNELSVENLREIFEIRLLLENRALRAAAKLRTKESLDRLNRIQERYNRAVLDCDPGQMMSLNQAFHFTIYDQARMPILLTVIKDMWLRISPYYHVMYRQTVLRDPRRGLRTHPKILEGLRRRDGDAACYWLSREINNSAEFVVEVFRAIGPSLACPFRNKPRNFFILPNIEQPFQAMTKSGLCHYIHR